MTDMLENKSFNRFHPTLKISVIFYSIARVNNLGGRNRYQRSGLLGTIVSALDVWEGGGGTEKLKGWETPVL